MTLLEIMIGLTILGVLISMGLPSYTVWIQNSKIRNAAESVQNGLQLARSEALRLNTDVQFIFGTDSDWNVRVAASAATVQSRSRGQGSTGVTVARVPAGATMVTFNSLGRTVPNAGGTNSFSQVDFDVPSTVLPPESTRDLRITVSSGGRIRMCDPNVSNTSDTRSC
jgi:type IV fimbrial biogenesis protein FimT